MVKAVLLAFQRLRRAHERAEQDIPQEHQQPQSGGGGCEGCDDIGGKEEFQPEQRGPREGSQDSRKEQEPTRGGSFLFTLSSLLGCPRPGP